jgi:predicted dehydrogenase
MKTIAVIGCGRIAYGAHFPAFAQIEGLRIKYACDIIESKAQAMKEKYPQMVENVITDYNVALADPEVEAVFILTPNYSHYVITMDALRAGKHVFCEKPITINYELSCEMAEEAKKQGKLLNIGVVNRYQRSVEILEQMNREGKFGNIYHVYCSFRRYRGIPGLGGDFTTKSQSGGGVLIDCGVHYFDIVQWYTGSKIVEVNGFGVKTQDDVARDNFNMITFRMENGCSGYYEVAWGQSVRTCNLKEFIGTKGRISLDMVISRSEDGEEGDKITVYHSDTGVYETVNVQTKYKDLYAQIKALIDMIENDTPGNPTIDEVWRAFLVAQAAQESVETGKPVRIEE